MLKNITNRFHLFAYFPLRLDFSIGVFMEWNLELLNM